MVRYIGYLMMLAAASGMEMKETVERMVMVRTTGKDQQPAATGFIYKRDSDGPAKVLKMGESEILHHLKGLPGSTSSFDKLTSFAAPLPAHGPFHTKNQDESKAASNSDQAYLIPIIDKSEDDHHIPGVADDDYERFLGEYASDFENYKGYNFVDEPAYYKSDFGDYLHGLGHHHLHGLNHDSHSYGGGSDYGADDNSAHRDKDFVGYASKHHYGKGDAGDYHNENHESFAINSGDAQDKSFSDGDAFGGAFANKHGIAGDNHGHKTGHSQGEETDGYHNIFEKDEFKKDYGFYDGKGNDGGYGIYENEDKSDGSASEGFAKGGSGSSGFEGTGYGKDGFNDNGVADEHGSKHAAADSADISHHNDSEFATKLEDYGGKGFGFQILHR